MQELAEHSEHEYTFFGATQDPLCSGIEPITPDRLQLVNFRAARTWQPYEHLALQPAAAMQGIAGNYDVFILEGTFTHPTAWMGMMAAQARGKRVLLYTHGWKRRDKNALVGHLRLAFMRRADGILLYGQRAKAIASSFGISSGQLHVANNSLDYRAMVSVRETCSAQQQQQLKERLFGDHRLSVIAHLGRLTAAKRAALLLDACSMLIARGCKVGVLMIGDGPELLPLQNAAHLLDIPAHFTGALYDEDQIGLMLSAADVLAAPGPVGLAAIHAMTYGTPVVACDDWDLHGPEIEAVVSGQTGAFYRTGDAQALAAALLPFVVESTTRSRYASNAMTVIDRYYNPHYMRHVFDRAVRGEAPVDISLGSPQLDVDS